MLNQSYFYWYMIRKYIIVFGKIFSDIHIQNAVGAVTNDRLVQLTYANKEKMIYQMDERHSQDNNDPNFATILPRMGYTLTSMRPDPTRRTNQMNEIQVSVSGGTTETFMYNKKPFDFTFELSVWSKTLDHLYQIIEQASSFFNPDYTVTVKEISELGLKSDVPITLDDITFNNTTEYNEEGWRILEATLNFTMRGWIYPPIKNSKIINEILVRMYSGDQTIPDYAETLFTEYTGNPPAIHQSIIDETPT